MNIHYNETALLGVLKNVYEFIRTPITVYDENFRYVTHYSVDSLGQYCRLSKDARSRMTRVAQDVVLRSRGNPIAVMQVLTKP